MILVVYKGLSLAWVEADDLSLLATGIFIAPYFLFSATAGQLADRYDKAAVMRQVKLVELVLAGVALVGLIGENVELMFVVLALLGLQSTFFGPPKYGILPELLDEEGLVEGNALLETGTKLAILLGTIGGGLLANREGGPALVGGIVSLVAIAGYLSARAIPSREAAEPDLKVEWNPITPTWKVLQVTRENRPVYLGILGISWFWLLGAALVGIFPVYGKSVLFADESVVTTFLAMFSVGVGLGALFCSRLSHDRLELGLVPFGSIGLTVFLADLAWLGQPWAQPTGLLALSGFLGRPTGLRILLDLLAVSIFSGLFIIPLYTMIQQRTEPRLRSRVIAGNNIINSVFIVTGSVALVALRNGGFTVAEIFFVLALANALVASYIYSLLPEFFLRFVAYLAAHGVYRLQTQGTETIPSHGPAVLVCNHVSFIDWLVVAAAVRRPVRFVMWYTYFEIPFIRYLFRDARVIPIASAKKDETVLDQAYERIAEELEAGELLCLFPEGMLSRDGQMTEFKSGIEKIVERTPVPVIPMALRGLWGSFFSYAQDNAWQRLRKRGWRTPIELVVGEPLPPERVRADGLRQTVEVLRGAKL